MMMNKIIVGGIVTLLISVLLAIGGWNLKAVADMPNEYIKKKEVQIFMEKNEKDHCRIEDKLDKIYDHLLEKDK